MLHVSRSPDSGSLALGEWLPRDDRPLSDAAERLMDGAGLDPDLRPTAIYIIPAQAAFCRGGWSGFATDPPRSAIHLCSFVARALADPTSIDERDWGRRPARAPAIFLHECGHVALGKLFPLPVPARLLRVAPGFASGGHDPLFAAVVATLYMRCGIEAPVGAYDCGWASVGSDDWAGPDWALDWAQGFANRHAAHPEFVHQLALAALREFDGQFFAREPAWWQWWRRSGNGWAVARGYRWMRESLLRR